MTENADYAEKIRDLVALIRHLRSPEGCPWDREHHFADYLQMLLEEARELKEALSQSREALREELGDTFWNALYLLVLAEDELGLPMAEILREVEEKIVRRHPHVFGDERAETPEEVMKTWQKVKEREKQAKRNRSSS